MANNPRIGDLVDGYMYMGGDPANQNSWRQPMQQNMGPRTIQEQHPDLTWKDRLVVKNLASSPEAMMSYIQKEHPNLEIEHNDQGAIRVKRPEEKDFRVLDPEGFNGFGEMIKDIGDVGYDIASGIGTGAATAAGGLAGAAGSAGLGALPAAAASGAAASGGLEALRQGLGSKLGLENNMDLGQIGTAAAFGAASPLLFGTGASAANIAARSAGLGEAEKLALKQSQQGLVGRFGNALKKSAETRAYKALGPYAREAQKDFAKDQINSMGREVLDSGALSGVAPKSYETIAERLGVAADKAGKEVGNIVEKLDAKGAVLPKQQVADTVLSALKVAKEIPGSDARNIANQAFVDDFLAKNKDMSIVEAQKLKKLIGEQINFDRPSITDIPEVEQRFRALYTALNKGAEGVAETAAGKQGEVSKNAFMAAKKKYGLLTEANKIIDKRSAKEIANRLISPSDYLAGATGAVAGFSSGGDLEDRIKRAAIGASLGGVNKFGRTFGSQYGAKALDALGNTLKSQYMAPSAAAIWNAMRTGQGQEGQ